MIQRILNFIVITSFLLTTLGHMPQAQADNVLGLPMPGAMVNLSPAFEPLLIKGLKVNPKNPLALDFIVDTGNSGLTVQDGGLKKDSEKLIKYFFAALTLPEQDVWVNLSPYEKDRIIPVTTGETEMGRDMLAQDYVLKQITASLMYPEQGLGKDFWDKVYKESYQRFGTTQVPVNTFNKVWIVADKAKVIENIDTVLVVDTHLKVMLEEDYLAKSKGDKSDRKDQISAQIIREIIIPALENEVNEGKNFANLRQIFYSLVLAKWYKESLKTALLNQVYANKAKVAGIETDDKNINKKIYEQYLQAYKKGVFNLIKEDFDQATQKTTPRKYFSGGMHLLKDLKLEHESASHFSLGLKKFTGLVFLIGSLATSAMPLTHSDEAMKVLGLDEEYRGDFNKDNVVRIEAPKTGFRGIKLAYEPITRRYTLMDVMLTDIGLAVKTPGEEQFIQANDPKEIFRGITISFDGKYAIVTKTGRSNYHYVYVNRHEEIIVKAGNVKEIKTRIGKAIITHNIPEVIVEYNGKEFLFQINIKEERKSLYGKKQYRMPYALKFSSTGRISSTKIDLPVILKSSQENGASNYWELNLTEFEEEELKKYVKQNWHDGSAVGISSFKARLKASVPRYIGHGVRESSIVGKGHLPQIVSYTRITEEMPKRKISITSRSGDLNGDHIGLCMTGKEFEEFALKAFKANPRTGLSLLDKLDEVSADDQPNTAVWVRAIIAQFLVDMEFDDGYVLDVKDIKGGFRVMAAGSKESHVAGVIKRKLETLRQRFSNHSIEIIESRDHSIQLAIVDKAMRADFIRGGIDLNAPKIDVERSGQKIQMEFDKAMLAKFEQGNFSGIRPVIVSITQISTVLPLFGLKLGTH